MRLLLAALLVGSAGLYAAYAVNHKAAPKDEDQAGRFKAVRKKYDEEFEELRKRAEGAAQAEVKGIISELKELSTLTTEKIVKVVELDPKSPTAFEAVRFAFGMLIPRGADPADVEKLAAAVVAHHLTNPKIADLVLSAGRAGPAGESLLKTVAEKSADQKVRGLALFTLGSTYAEQVNDAAGEKAASELTAKAIENFEKAVKESPMLRIGSSTIEQAATAEIKTLKQLGIGQPAPDVEGTDLDGKKAKLSSYKGKVVLLDVWATWCPPCRAMIPHEREMVKKLSGAPFVLISVSADAEKDDLTTFLKKEPMPWVHWWEGESGSILKTYRVSAFPTLYLLDAKGVIRKKWLGAPPPEQLDKSVEELVKEAASR